MTEQTLDQRFSDAMGQLLGPEFPTEIGLAVSGGGDSMAMLALAHAWTRGWGVRLRVVTVDHGLRAESADEAAMVARECATLGWPHDTLTWHWDGTGNVQDAARRARLDLIGAWCGDLRHVLMAHTADDVAETFLIRLARGSGVEGLAAMQPRRSVGAFDVVRPCLEMDRAELRFYARTLHVPWVEDPSNDDPKYARATARKLLGSLEELGLTKSGLIDTAYRMRRASDALQARCKEAADSSVVSTAHGTVVLAISRFQKVERDTQMRLFAAALTWISTAKYRPRAEQLERLLDRVLSGGAGTLMGVKVENQGDQICAYREYSAVHSEAAPMGALWDGRWAVSGPEHANLSIRALGEAVSNCPDWRDSGLSHAAIMATPSLWEGENLVSAPVAGHNMLWSAQIVTTFTTYLLSH